MRSNFNDQGVSLDVIYGIIAMHFLILHSSYGLCLFLELHIRPGSTFRCSVVWA